jgi:hypothetical protein
VIPSDYFFFFFKGAMQSFEVYRSQQKDPDQATALIAEQLFVVNQAAFALAILEVTLRVLK